LAAQAAAAALQPAAEMELLRRLGARAEAPEMPEMPALAVVATFKVRRSGRDQVEGQMDGLKMRIVFLNGFSWNVFFWNAFSIFGLFFFVDVWFAQKIPLSWRCWSVYGRDM